MSEIKRYTSRSHWPDGHWCIALAQFLGNDMRLPKSGQWVPQEVIDKLARLEDLEEAENGDGAINHTDRGKSLCN